MIYFRNSNFFLYISFFILYVSFIWIFPENHYPDIKYLKYDLGLISIPGTVKFGVVTIKLSFILGYSISILVAIIYNATSLSKSIDKYFENLYGITFNKR